MEAENSILSGSSDGSELFQDLEFCHGYIEAQSRHQTELFGCYRRACDLLRQVSDIANGASIYLGHNERIVKDIDKFLRKNGPADV